MKSAFGWPLGIEERGLIPFSILGGVTVGKEKLLSGFLNYKGV